MQVMDPLGCLEIGLIWRCQGKQRLSLVDCACSWVGLFHQDVARVEVVLDDWKKPWILRRNEGFLAIIFD